MCVKWLGVCEEITKIEGEQKSHSSRQKCASLRSGPYLPEEAFLSLSSPILRTYPKYLYLVYIQSMVASAIFLTDLKVRSWVYRWIGDMYYPQICQYNQFVGKTRRICALECHTPLAIPLLPCFGFLGIINAIHSYSTNI